MIPSSQDYKNIVQSDDRQFLAKLLLNDAEILCDITQLTVTKGSCGTPEGFNVGAVV